MTREEVIERLREIGTMKIGTQPEAMPQWLRADTNHWGVALSELCREAAKLLEAFVEDEYERHGNVDNL